MAKQFKPETLCVQAGWTPKKGEPRVLPIYQSTPFKRAAVDRSRERIVYNQRYTVTMGNAGKFFNIQYFQ